jgi:RNA 2',3'-cyclic 3'-phosphodiesterase
LEIAQGRLAERIRAFVGIGIPDAQRQLLAGYLGACRVAAPELRWVSAENLHLTLRFLGQVDTARLEELSRELRRLPVQPFSLRLGGLGSFGRGAAVRVVWIGVTAGGRELEQLASAVEKCCAEAGLPPEDRAYNPHLTLARARRRRGARVPELPLPPELDAWRVDAFRLYRSRTAAGGAVYTVLEQFGGGAGTLSSAE